MRYVLTLFLLIGSSVVVHAQADVPATAKATIGQTQPLTIRLPAKTATFTMTVVPPEGITLWREHDPDPLMIKLRIELTTKSGKAQATKYYLVASIDNKSTICTISVEDAAPDIPTVPVPVPTDDVVKQLKALTDQVAAIDRRLTAVEKPLPTPPPVPVPIPPASGNVPTKAQIEQFAASLAWMRDPANAGKFTSRLDATADMLAIVLSSWGQSLPPIDPKPANPVAKSLTFVVLTPTGKTVAVTEPDGPGSFRAWLASQGIGVYGITTQLQLTANPKFNVMAPPSIVLQDATNAIIASAPLTDESSARAFVQKYLGAK